MREGKDSVQCCVCEWLQARHCVLLVLVCWCEMCIDINHVSLTKHIMSASMYGQIFSMSLPSHSGLQIHSLCRSIFTDTNTVSLHKSKSGGIS